MKGGYVNDRRVNRLVVLQQGESVIPGRLARNVGFTSTCNSPYNNHRIDLEEIYFEDGTRLMPTAAGYTPTRHIERIAEPTPEPEPIERIATFGGTRSKGRRARLRYRLRRAHHSDKRAKYKSSFEREQVGWLTAFMVYIGAWIVKLIRKVL